MPEDSIKRINTKLKLLSILLQYDSGNPEPCIIACEEALKNSLHKEIEYTILGAIYHAQENFDEAIKYYNLAIEENDDYEMAYEGRNQAMLENHLKILDFQERLIKKGLKF